MNAQRGGGSTFGRPDATGRSSGKHKPKTAQNLRPPTGSNWAWLTADLLASPAWRALSVTARRLVDALMLENCLHAGQENGNLVRPYDRLAADGLTRDTINIAIREVEALGLVAVKHGGRYNGRNTPNVYRITFLGTLEAAPTDEWAKITADDVQGILERLKAERAAARTRKAQRKERRAKKPAKAVRSAESRTTVVRNHALPSTPEPDRPTNESAENRQSDDSPVVRNHALLSRYTAPGGGAGERGQLQDLKARLLAHFGHDRASAMTSRLQGPLESQIAVCEGLLAEQAPGSDTKEQPS